MSDKIKVSDNLNRTDRDVTAFGRPIERSITGPEGLPMRIFGNEIVGDPTRENEFGIVDRHGVTHWIEINWG